MSTIESDQYRFSGYQLPMIQLDDSGPSYVVNGIHPYYVNQPTFWQKPCYQTTSVVTSGTVGQENINNLSNPNNPSTKEETISKTSNLFGFSKF